MGNAPPQNQEICQRLFRGYQFSPSDRDNRDLEPLYLSLQEHFVWFQEHLGDVGFILQRDDDIMFLEKEGKELGDEERQAVVVLYLLADLWYQKGRSYNDLYQLPIVWSELEWFRDGYGKEYLAQVKIADGDFEAIEDVFGKMARKGFVLYRANTSTVTLRKPADRIITMAVAIHRQRQTANGDKDA